MARCSPLPIQRSPKKRRPWRNNFYNGHKWRRKNMRWFIENFPCASVSVCLCVIFLQFVEFPALLWLKIDVSNLAIDLWQMQTIYGEENFKWNFCYYYSLLVNGFAWDKKSFFLLLATNRCTNALFLNYVNVYMHKACYRSITFFHDFFSRFFFLFPHLTAFCVLSSYIHTCGMRWGISFNFFVCENFHASSKFCVFFFIS